MNSDRAPESLSEALAEVTALRVALAQVEQERDEARKDALYHHDCRPNRRQAEAYRDDAKAMNDKWADEVKARRDAEAALAAVRVACQQIACEMKGSTPDLQAKLCEWAAQLEAVVGRENG